MAEPLIVITEERQKRKRTVILFFLLFFLIILVTSSVYVWTLIFSPNAQSSSCGKAGINTATYFNSGHVGKMNALGAHWIEAYARAGADPNMLLNTKWEVGGIVKDLRNRGYNVIIRILCGDGSCSGGSSGCCIGPGRANNEDVIVNYIQSLVDVGARDFYVVLGHNEPNCSEYEDPKYERQFLQSLKSKLQGKNLPVKYLYPQIDPHCGAGDPVEYVKAVGTDLANDGFFAGIATAAYNTTSGEIGDQVLENFHNKLSGIGVNRPLFVTETGAMDKDFNKFKPMYARLLDKPYVQTALIFNGFGENPGFAYHSELSNINFTKSLSPCFAGGGTGYCSDTKLVARVQYLQKGKSWSPLYGNDGTGSPVKLPKDGVDVNDLKEFKVVSADGNTGSGLKPKGVTIAIKGAGFDKSYENQSVVDIYPNDFPKFKNGEKYIATVTLRDPTNAVCKATTSFIFNGTAVSPTVTPVPTNTPSPTVGPSENTPSPTPTEETKELGKNPLKCSDIKVVARLQYKYDGQWSPLKGNDYVRAEGDPVKFPPQDLVGNPSAINAISVLRLVAANARNGQGFANEGIYIELFDKANPSKKIFTTYNHSTLDITPQEISQNLQKDHEYVIGVKMVGSDNSVCYAESGFVYTGGFKQTMVIPTPVIPGDGKYICAPGEQVIIHTGANYSKSLKTIPKNEVSSEENLHKQKEYVYTTQCGQFVYNDRVNNKKVIVMPEASYEPIKFNIKLLHRKYNDNPLVKLTFDETFYYYGVSDQNGNTIVFIPKGIFDLNKIQTIKIEPIYYKPIEVTSSLKDLKNQKLEFEWGNFEVKNTPDSITAADYAVFLYLYKQGVLAADADASGKVWIRDYSLFMNAIRDYE